MELLPAAICRALQAACRDYLVDYMQVRYVEPYQTAYRSDQVFSLPLGVAQGQGEWDTTGLPQALREYPPTITAAGWVAQVLLLSCHFTHHVLQAAHTVAPFLTIQQSAQHTNRAAHIHSPHGLPYTFHIPWVVHTLASFGNAAACTTCSAMPLQSG